MKSIYRVLTGLSNYHSGALPACRKPGNIPVSREKLGQIVWKIHDRRRGLWNRMSQGGKMIGFGFVIDEEGFLSMANNVRRLHFQIALRRINPNGRISVFHSPTLRFIVHPLTFTPRCSFQ
jgi:hypothetical protein